MSTAIPNNSIAWLQSWYQSQCNDDWEHEHGVAIETLDNPGWVVKVDLTGTALQDVPMEAVTHSEINHMGIDGDHGWLDCKVEDNQFLGAGGPMALIEICDVFMNWAAGVNRQGSGARRGPKTHEPGPPTR